MHKSRATAYYVSLFDSIDHDDDRTERQVVLRDILDGPRFPFGTPIFLIGGAFAAATAYYTALAQMPVAAIGMAALATWCGWGLMNELLDYFAARTFPGDKRVELIHELLAKDLITRHEWQVLLKEVEDTSDAT